VFNGTAVLKGFYILGHLEVTKPSDIIYRSSKLLLCNNTEIWSRKHGCNSISKYCQLPEWRCSYFYYDIYYVSIKKLFWNQVHSDGGAHVKMFKKIFI